MADRRRGLDAFGSDPSASPRPFEVEAKTGHAWFARQEKTRGAVARRPTTLPVLRQAELVLSGQTRAVAHRALRIPADSIVSLTSPAIPRAIVEPAEASSVRRGANDNVSKGGRMPTWLREVLFLAIFVATLLGTYFVGRQHAVENVIVVPETIDRAHRIT